MAKVCEVRRIRFSSVLDQIDLNYSSGSKSSGIYGREGLAHSQPIRVVQCNTGGF